MSAKAHFNRLTLHCRQSLLDLIHGLQSLLSNKLQRHVQGLRPDPARIRRKLTHALHKAANAVADGVVDVEGDEGSHGRKCDLPRNIRRRIRITVTLMITT